MRLTGAQEELMSCSRDQIQELEAPGVSHQGKLNLILRHHLESKGHVSSVETADAGNFLVRPADQVEVRIVE